PPGANYSPPSTIILCCPCWFLLVLHAYLMLCRGSLPGIIAKGRERVSVFWVGRADVHYLMLRAQNASHWLVSLLKRARRWHISWVPSSPQRMPASLSRWPTTVLQADSTDPEPMNQPLAR